VAKTVVRFLPDEHKSGSLINIPRRDKNVVGPQYHFPVALAPGESDTFVHQAFSQTDAASPRVDQQQAKLGHFLTVLYDKCGTDNLSTHLRDPAAFPLGIVMVDKIGTDLRNQRLKAFIPAEPKFIILIIFWIRQSFSHFYYVGYNMIEDDPFGDDDHALSQRS
jgi:hypothetical protein